MSNNEWIKEMLMKYGTRKNVIVDILSTVPPDLYFTYENSIIIFSHSYYKISEAIKNYKVDLKFVKKFDDDAGAKYLPRCNQMIFKTDFQNTPFLVIHEATHAILDINRTFLSTATNEALSYIAESMYLILLGKDMSNYRKVRQRAGVIAADLLAQPHPLRNLTQNDERLQELRKTISSNALYGGSVFMTFSKGDG